MMKMKVIRILVMTSMLVGALSSCGSSSDSAASFVESGKALIAEGKIEKARLEFKNAIQIDPRQAEPFYQLALLDEKDQKWKGMFANLTTVEQLAPTRYDAIVKLGQLHLLAGNFDIAMEKADKVLAADKNNMMAYVLRASVNMKQQHFDEATQDIDQALALDSGNTEAISVKTLILQQQGQSDRALVLLNGAIKQHPEQLPLTLIKLSILEGQKNYSEMENVYKSLMVKYPDEVWIPVSMAKLMNMQDRYNDAKQVLQQFIAANPDEKQAKILLISLMQTKEPEQTIVLLDEYIQQDKTNFDLRFAKVKLQLTDANKDAAVAELKQIATLDPEGNSGRQAQVLLAKIDLQNGDVKAAETMVEQILTVSPEDEGALLLKANIDIMNKNIDTAVTNLRVVLRNNPESEEALVLLAQAYMISGSTELADDNFRQALAVNPGNTVAALSVANNLMKERDLNRSEEVLVNALKQDPNKESLLQALAQVRIFKKDWSGSEAVVDTLRADNKESAVAYFLNARIAQGQEQYSKAIEQYKLALALKPDMARALQGLAFSSIQLGEKQALVDFLKSFIIDNPRQFSAYNVLSNIYSQDKSWGEAINIVEQGLAVEPKWQAGYSVLASIYYAQNMTNKVFESYQRGIKSNPDSSFLSLQLASAYERNGDYKKAKTLYETLLDKDKSLEPAINNLASLYTDQFNSEDNLKKALDLSSSFKNSTEPYYLDTYAWVNVQLNKLDEAQPILERVVKLSPDVAIFNYHLGLLYSKKGNAVKAEEYLNKAKKLADEQGDKTLANKVNELLPNN
tara:strand:- start:86858 stop:89251 length:2394 start_codon:yes stop_codon:yes gene_type:complete